MLEDFKGVEFRLDLNKLKIPVNEIKANDEGMKKFNEIYFYLKDNFPRGIVWTPSGGISTRDLYRRVPAWDITPDKAKKRSCIELVALLPQGCYRILFGHEKSPENRQMNGHTAFITFKKECLKDGVDITKYYISNGEDVKKEIEKPLIGLTDPRYKDLIWDDAHHIDTRNAWPAGLAQTHPELANTIQRIFNGRTQHPTYKAVLNFSIGYFQSINNFGAKLAQFSRDAINRSNDNLRAVAGAATNAGRLIIAYNTDGFWYIGDPFHGAGEGQGLGEWRNDHLHCKLRFKSDGAYEYIENGKYTPVIRGRTCLDAQKDREQWEWGDIYNDECHIIKYGFSEEYGIISEAKLNEYNVKWRIDPNA